MTIQGLIDKFRTTYDIGSLGLPGFEDSEIQELLELAQYRVISQKFGGNNVYKQKFPDTPKRIDDLRLLINRDDSITITPGLLGYSIVTLPTSYLHIVELHVVYDNNLIEKAEQIDYDNIIRFQKNNRNVAPYIKDPIFVFDNLGFLRLYVDSTQVSAIDTGAMTYIKKPASLEAAVGTTVTDFNDDVYYEIVASAVNEAIEIATPNKSQISNQQLTKSE